MKTNKIILFGAVGAGLLYLINKVNVAAFSPAGVEAQRAFGENLEEALNDQTISKGEADQLQGLFQSTLQGSTSSGMRLINQATSKGVQLPRTSIPASNMVTTKVKSTGESVTGQLVKLSGGSTKFVGIVNKSGTPKASSIASKNEDRKLVASSRDGRIKVYTGYGTKKTVKV